jgi:hypothetical protein
MQILLPRIKHKDQTLVSDTSSFQNEEEEGDHHHHDGDGDDGEGERRIK